MATYNVKEGSLKVLGPNKVSMIVSFQKDSGKKSAEQYFEVDSTDKEKIDQVLSAAAFSFENQPEDAPLAKDIGIETGKDVEAVLPPVVPEQLEDEIVEETTESPSEV